MLLSSKEVTRKKKGKGKIYIIVLYIKYDIKYDEDILLIFLSFMFLLLFPCTRRFVSLFFFLFLLVLDITTVPFYFNQSVFDIFLDCL